MNAGDCRELFGILGAIIPGMSNHPNRSKSAPSLAANPSPAEIRRAREDAGMTQTEAGAVIYSSLRAWQDWEAGERRMHPAMWELWRIKVAALRGRTP